MVQNNQKLRRMNIPRMGANEDPAKYAELLRKLVQDEFNRLSTDFYQFRQETLNAAVIPLKPVSMITTTADQYSVAVTWENPQQDTITPTHVRIRIPEAFETWAEYTYPRNTWEFNGLLPSTSYTVEIYLIARYEDTISYVSAMRNCPSLPVQRVAESEVRTRAFTTAAGVSPPEQGTGNTTTFPFPETETPGPVGGTDCWWEYLFQYFDETLTGGTWVDTIYTGEFDGDADLVDFDQTQLDCTILHRMRYREVCDGVNGVWVDATPFIPACDWADPCGGMTPSDSAATIPYDDADLFIIPQVCVRDGEGFVIEDGVTEINLTPMSPGYDTIHRTDGEWTLRGFNASSFQSPMLTGNLPLVGALTGQSDFSVSVEIKLASTSGIGTYIIVMLGTKFRVSINMVPGGWTASMIAPWAGGGTMNLTSTTVIPVGQWGNVTCVVDADGDKSLYVQGALEKESANVIELDLTGMTDDIGIFALDEIEVRTLYGWNRALNSGEIPGVPFNPFWTTTTGVTETISVEIGDVLLAMTLDGQLTSPGTGAPSLSGTYGTWTEISEVLHDPVGVGNYVYTLWAAEMIAAGSFVTAGDTYVWAKLSDLDLSSGLDSALQVAGNNGSFTASVVIPRRADGPGASSIAMIGSGLSAVEVDPPTITTPGAEVGAYVSNSTMTDYAGQLAGVVMPSDSAGLAGTWSGSVAGGSGGFLINYRRAADAPFTPYLDMVTQGLQNYQASTTSMSLIIPAVSDGDVIVVAVAARSAITMPAGFTSQVSQVADPPPAPNAAFIGRVAIYSGVEGTDFNIGGTTINVVQASAGRLNAVSYILRGNVALANPVPVDTVTGKANSAIDAPHTFTTGLIAPDSGGVIITANTCLFAVTGYAAFSSEGNLTVTASAADTRGFFGVIEDITEAHDADLYMTDTSSTHYGAQCAALFVTS